jgi:O-antigen/teichoic acid export membrane protein
LAATAGPTITLFAGERYGEGTLPLAILAIGLGLTSASVVIGSSLLAVGSTRVVISASAIGILADIAFAPLIFLQGVTGAALSRVALMTASLGFSWIISERKFPRSVDLGAFYKVVACCFIEGGVVLAAEFVLYDARLLPFYIVLGLVGYLVSLRVLKIVNSGDVALLHRFVPSSLRFLVDIFGWLMSAR